VLKPHRSGGAAPRFLRFEDETAEANSIVREIAQKVEREDEERAPLHDFAILFRTNEQPRAFELELRRAKLRYTLVGGRSFFDRKEVRDMLAYLKLLAFPGDELSLLRVINTPSRGIGASTIKALMEVAIGKGKPLGEVLPQAIVEADLPPPIVERIRGFERLIDGYRARLESEPTSVVMRALVKEIDYKAELERTCKAPAEVEGRYLAVDGVVRSIEEYEARTEEATLHGFLEDTALAGRDDLGDDRQKQSGVTLMTLHSAKGLEFPHVYMVGMEEGLLPHRRVIAEGNGVEEERRLCYVGVTRAEDTLTLSLCKTRTKWGKARPSIPSRFLLEMRGEKEKAAQAAEASQVAIARDLAAVAAAEREANSAAKKKKRRSAAKPAPSRPAADAPSRAGAGVSSRPGAEASSRAAGAVTPARPAAGTPSRPGAVAPARPATGAPLRPATGAPLRPATGAPLRPATGAPLRPATGAPLRPAPGTPPGPGGAPHARR
jgi:DNA helicase-2/ATP-dependent DNA helicase PcrA